MNPPLICSVGDLISDVVVLLDRDPQRGTDTPAKIQRTRGGSAANVCAAVVAAGGRSRFVGQVGNDADGELLTASLAAAGVEMHASRQGSSGTIVALVDSSGERSFLTDRGASIHLSFIDSAVLDNVDVLHVPLYSLVTGALAEATQRLIGEAIDREIPVTLGTSSVSVLAEFGRGEFLALVKNLKPHIVFANHDEARFALDGHPWFVGAGATVVTAGSRPARFTRPDGSDWRSAPEETLVTDTTGAGDGFTAGFLVSWCGGDDPEVWLAAGHRLARRSLNAVGASLDSLR